MKKKGKGLEWCIVGRNPETWLLDKATSCKSIRLTGYVEDLFSLVREYPVMVNPMISGSGMKNKVLEAFALNIAVVSTPLGMESIDGAVAGTHYLKADDPEEFAKSIQSLLDDEQKRSVIAKNANKLLLEKFTWERTGEKWLHIFQSCLNN
ncbi:MAG: glycosyltransferase family 4 protein [Planctomycetota bacterium]